MTRLPILPIVALSLLGLIALAAPVLPLPNPVTMDVAHRLAGPGAGHLLGQDEFGRDELARLIWGARTSLAVALSATLIACVVGTALGLVGGFLRGIAELLAVRSMDVVLCFPPLLLAVLVGVGFGHWYGWHGNRILVGGDRPGDGFCNTVAQYDDSTLGPRVDPSDLPDFCLKLTAFQATYQPTGQPKTFSATVEASENGGPDQIRQFTVNQPLRLHHANIHLLGHGYAPIVRYTDKYGVAQTKIVPFLPVDAMQTSEGVVQFPDVNIDPKTNKRVEGEQVAFEGRYLPTVGTDGAPTTVYPAENAPALFLTAYRGDLGLDVGTPGSVYALNQEQLASGDLKNISGARPHKLAVGQSWTLDDGGKLEFLGTRPFATLSIRYDPTQSLVLAGAVLGLLGLMLSLAGHRRRVWFRALPGSDAEPGGTLVAAGGLPRTDYPGFGDEFTALVKAAEEGTP